MKGTKRLTGLLVAVALLVAAAPPVTAFADESPPELELVTVYSEQVAPGDSLTVGADIWDYDGIEQAILRFAHASGYTVEVTLGHTMGYGDAGERYSGKLLLPTDAPEGQYALVFASLLDKGFARSRYYAPDALPENSSNSFPLPEQPSFEVTAAAAKVEEPFDSGYNDSVAPRLTEAALQATEPLANGGTRFLLAITATDTAATGEEASEIAHLTLRLRNSKNGRTLSKVFTAKDRTHDSYTAWLEVGPYEPGGSFVLDSVTLTDRAFNTARYCRPADVRRNKQPLPGSLTLKLVSDAAFADTTPPVLTAIMLQKTELDAGGRMTVTATATDNLSGVQSVSLQLCSTEGKSITVLLTNNGDGTLGGAINSYQTGKAGSYTLNRASVLDRAGNRRSYYKQPPAGGNPLPCTAAFTIRERSQQP